MIKDTFHKDVEHLQVGQSFPEVSLSQRSNQRLSGGGKLPQPYTNNPDTPEMLLSLPMPPSNYPALQNHKPNGCWQMPMPFTFLRLLHPAGIHICQNCLLLSFRPSRISVREKHSPSLLIEALTTTYINRKLCLILLLQKIETTYFVFFFVSATGLTYNDNDNNHDNDNNNSSKF